MARKIFMWLLGLASVCNAAMVHARDPESISTKQFDELHAMFKTQPGESKYWELPWMIQLDEAIAKGAAEGKPIFVWCGAGGAPVGVC